MMKKKFNKTLTLESSRLYDDHQPLDTRAPSDHASKPGLVGTFVTIENDFSILTSPGQDGQTTTEPVDIYRDERHWTRETREQVKRVRYFICSLALVGLALSLMSRLILNVSIVEMVKKVGPPVEIAAQEEPQAVQASSSSDDGLHFDWSKRDVNVILGSFYMGYAPGILFSGGIAQRYGAKWPLFVCVFGSALINLFTPEIAQTNLNLLIASRITLGLIQGSLVPCLYELYNRWLTQTESSIFVPLIRLPLGAILGTMLPGLLASFKLDWPHLFHIGGYLCLAWSLAWAMLATSRPQDNNLVEASELKRIMRKKAAHLQQVTTSTTINGNKSALPPAAAAAATVKPKSTPWLLIVTNPSVLALIAVKFTGNLATDLIFLQIAVYLREVHQAPIETISVIASGNYVMQMLFIVFVGWFAKVVVLNRALGLSVTKWRKIFSGGSNFCMALTYLVLAYARPHLLVTTGLFLSVCFFSMFAAGGESMIPYDLTSEYPATIVGFTHSVSIFSAIVLTGVCDIILGEHTEEPARWSLLFYLLAGALALGGLVFVLVVKAKPFLPGEKVPKDLAAQKVVCSISHGQVGGRLPRDDDGDNKQFAR